MMQEIHHKLMLRVRQKREEILSNDYRGCPRIMKKVNQAVTASRDWRAAWDGERKYVVSICWQFSFVSYHLILKVFGTFNF